MSELKGACIIGQSGGPTSVINTSVLGAIETALDCPSITRVLGAAHGIRGVLDDQLLDIDKEDREELKLLRYTPSSALGSCRYKLADPDVDDTDYKRILEIFKKYDVRYFFYNGGNDSMDTCNKISKFMMKSGYECRVMGIPKTIDNDLFGTDHCPGYASASKYIATSCMEIYQDARVYDTGMVCIVEIMGRHAGWLTAAAGLATAQGASLTSFTSRRPTLTWTSSWLMSKRFMQKRATVWLLFPRVSTTQTAPSFPRQRPLQPTALVMHSWAVLLQCWQTRLKSELGVKVRGIKLSLLQRCAAHCASPSRRRRVYASGKAAVENAVAGKTDFMPGFKCTRDGGYKCEIELLPLSQVANTEKKVPREWINAEGNGVTQAYIDYAMPLIAGDNVGPKENGLPRFAKLKKLRLTALIFI